MGSQKQAKRLSRSSWRHPGWNSSWSAALLAATILSSCVWLTGAKGSVSAKIAVMVDPSKPRAGQDVILTPEGEPDFDNCRWYRGATADFTKQIFTYYPSTDVPQQNGAGYTGRETGGPGCSLTIRNLTVNDAGNYTVKKTGRGIMASEEGGVDIVVSDGPYIRLNPGGTLKLKRDSDLKLECTGDSVPAAQLQWFFNHMKLNVTGSTFSTRLKDWKDQGTYTCQATNPSTNRTVFASVSVKMKKGSSVSRSLEAGSLAGILVGSLAILALNGTLLYFIFRARGQNDKTSGQIEAAPSSSDNLGPSREVKTESSADNHVYQTLQHGDRATYDQLNIATDKSTDLYAVAE